MATKFALKPLFIVMPDGVTKTFWFDGNGKITVGNGTFVQPVANSFSLVQVEDCPFATKLCGSVCYVHRLEKAEAEVHSKYRYNSVTIREVLRDHTYAGTVREMFASYIYAYARKGFRWHVSGDIFSLEYAEFIAAICKMTPGVMQWIYTRSFPYVEPLLNIENLAINLSADAENYAKALVLHERHGLRMCYMTVDGSLPPDLPAGSVIFPSHELRGRELPDPKQAPWWQTLAPQQKRMVCPPDFFGQSEHLRCGPCRKCLL
ncbi:MAG: hypothetical protein A3C81_02540 [Candidatus Yanofskybacteria bacterium RIFCSPHIGHO2_02_FULL_46_19]|uniref:Gene product 88 domain-containing protein n=2 Tax=Candidatus Yanofskyibacteriota TaxID=1752733 RepID=A0A1F8FV63_9BACT|nr:MAG: hypothetical protein A3C81_02540 [Candidatus Yanofskybacteria bacterium RIFCSPHIGHO2_02_FULL_46_19]